MDSSESEHGITWPEIYAYYFSGELKRALPGVEFEFCRRNLTLACCALSLERDDYIMKSGLNQFNRLLPESSVSLTAQEWRPMVTTAAANVTGKHPTETDKQILSGLALGELYYKDLGQVILSANQ